MKLQLTLLSSLLIVALFAGCRKDSPSPSVSTSSSNNNLSSMARETGDLSVCYGYTLKNDDGNYSCPSGTGCAKITKGGCSSAVGSTGGNSITSDDYSDFKDAYDGGTLETYFKSFKWFNLFRKLLRRPELLRKLQNGSVTFVEEKNADGSLFYLAVPTALTASFTTADVKYALELPAGTL